MFVQRKYSITVVYIVTITSFVPQLVMGSNYYITLMAFFSELVIMINLEKSTPMILSSLYIKIHSIKYFQQIPSKKNLHKQT